MHSHSQRRNWELFYCHITPLPQSNFCPVRIWSKAVEEREENLLMWAWLFPPVSCESGKSLSSERNDLDRSLEIVACGILSGSQHCNKGADIVERVQDEEKLPID
jgi:hypothetical protein